MYIYLWAVITKYVETDHFICVFLNVIPCPALLFYIKTILYVNVLVV